MAVGWTAGRKGAYLGCQGAGMGLGPTSDCRGHPAAKERWNQVQLLSTGNATGTEMAGCPAVAGTMTAAGNVAASVTKTGIDGSVTGSGMAATEVERRTAAGCSGTAVTRTRTGPEAAGMLLVLGLMPARQALVQPAVELLGVVAVLTAPWTVHLALTGPPCSAQHQLWMALQVMTTQQQQAGSSAAKAGT